MRNNHQPNGWKPLDGASCRHTLWKPAFSLLSGPRFCWAKEPPDVVRVDLAGPGIGLGRGSERNRFDAYRGQRRGGGPDHDGSGRDHRDEVSTTIAQRFGMHARQLQAIGARAAAEARAAPAALVAPAAHRALEGPAIPRQHRHQQHEWLARLSRSGLAGLDRHRLTSPGAAGPSVLRTPPAPNSIARQPGPARCRPWHRATTPSPRPSAPRGPAASARG
jgi:PE family